MNRLCKGLHYVMWMQDQMLLQEELADNIASLITLFAGEQQSVLFIKCMLLSLSNEWHLVDRWRMDKFLMVSQIFSFAYHNTWNRDVYKFFTLKEADYSKFADSGKDCHLIFFLGVNEEVETFHVVQSFHSNCVQGRFGWGTVMEREWSGGGMGAKGGVVGEAGVRVGGGWRVRTTLVVGTSIGRERHRFLIAVSFVAQLNSIEFVESLSHLCVCWKFCAV